MKRFLAMLAFVLAPLTLAAQSVKSVTLTLDSASMTVGSTTFARTTAKSASGQFIITKTVAFTASDTSAVRIIPITTTTAKIVAVKPGLVSITARVQNLSTSKPLSILAPAVVVPPPVDTTTPPPVVDTSLHVFAFSDFESGTIAPFFDPWAGIYPPDYLQVIPDPTNSGHGNVLSIRYVNDPSVGFLDNNHGVNLDPSDPARQMSYGDEVIFDGDLFIQKGPTDSVLSATGLRKLNYWCSNDTDWSQTPTVPQNHFCFVLSTQANGPGHPSGDEQLQWGISLAATQPGSAVTIPLQYSYTGLFLTENTWHHLQIIMKLNSSPSTQDGVFVMTLDGNVFVNRSDLWFVDPSWGPTQKLLAYDWRIGYQVNATDQIDETRYWDNLKFAMKRAVPK